MPQPMMSKCEDGTIEYFPSMKAFVKKFEFEYYQIKLGSIGMAKYIWSIPQQKYYEVAYSYKCDICKTYETWEQRHVRCIFECGRYICIDCSKFAYIDNDMSDLPIKARIGWCKNHKISEAVKEKLTTENREILKYGICHKCGLPMGDYCKTKLLFLCSACELKDQ